MAIEQPKEIFTSNVTLSTPDDVDGCLDLDAECWKWSRPPDAVRPHLQKAHAFRTVPCRAGAWVSVSALCISAFYWQSTTD